MSEKTRDRVVLTAFDLAQRFVGTEEVNGPVSNPMVLAMLKLDDTWPDDDAVPWCSAFVNFIAWELRLPRSKSLRARSWLDVGRPIELEDALVGFDIVVLKREIADPGPEVIDTAGHVGFFAGEKDDYISVLGGNQSNSVCITDYVKERLLGIRRLFEEDC